ncbi:hypothetical protein TWF481_002620 [Arthrobotrys musiformis]|uniref:Uncharacterized protein n=1 Tax=Arthrobotrys musiformis TaxID=47236 RepID=A0AAV9VRY2_9PEZI
MSSISTRRGKTEETDNMSELRARNDVYLERNRIEKAIYNSMNEALKFVNQTSKERDDAYAANASLVKRIRALESYIQRTQKKKYKYLMLDDTTLDIVPVGMKKGDLEDVNTSSHSASKQMELL